MENPYPDPAAGPLHAHPAFAFVRAEGGIEEYRHRRNGLAVLLSPEAAAPVAALQVTYRVGSRNEGAGLTGATHLLEHLMFKGTERYNREAGTSIFETLQAVGAQMNATTWYDRTNYYALVPAEHLPLVADIEADRMRGARVSEADLAAERTVVLNELDRGENEPFRTLFHAVFAAAFPAHPYGHPVIGWRSDVEEVSAGGLRHFYDTFYWPRNATVSVAGQIERAATLDLLDQHFGPIPASPNEDEGAEPIPDPTRAPRDVVTREAPQRGERRVTLRQAGELGAVLLGYKAPAGLDPDADALDVLVHVLSAGKSGRLFRALTDRGLASGAFAYYPRLRDPGLFLLFASLAPDVEHAEAEKALKEALNKIAREGISPSELARARRQTVAEEAFARDGPAALVAQLNEAIAVGDWTLFARYRDRVEAVTAEGVQAAAARLAEDDRLTVGWYVPTEASAEGAETSADSTEASGDSADPSAEASEASSQDPEPSAEGSAPSGDIPEPFAEASAPLDEASTLSAQDAEALAEGYDPSGKASAPSAADPQDPSAA